MGTYDPSRPAPEVFAARIVGHEKYGAEEIEISWMDTVNDEALTSVYSTGKRPPATQNIPGSNTSGTKASTVLLPKGTEVVQLRYLWTTDLSDPDKNIWGPFSNAVSIK